MARPALTVAWLGHAMRTAPPRAFEQRAGATDTPTTTADAPAICNDQRRSMPVAAGERFELVRTAALDITHLGVPTVYESTLPHPLNAGPILDPAAFAGRPRFADVAFLGAPVADASPSQSSDIALSIRAIPYPACRSSARNSAVAGRP
jgi:hypothetical protein